MIENYFKANTLKEALELKKINKGSEFIMGGTMLLAAFSRQYLGTLVDLSNILTNEIIEKNGDIFISAGITFQEIIDSKNLPKVLVKAAQCMGSRPIRNRASLGGNIATDKSCASLIPALLVLDAELEVFRTSTKELYKIQDWLNIHRARTEESGIIIKVKIPEYIKSYGFSYQRYSRTASDLSILETAVAVKIQDGIIKDVKIACGGISAKSRLLSEVEDFFLYKPVLEKSEIEKIITKYINPISDQRGSADFKRYRISVLVADALYLACKGK